MSRDASLDAARGLLMLLGVFLHAANIYTPGSGWLVADSHTHPVFGWVIHVLHAFRMPAFFWISGFFTAMVLSRENAGRHVRTRLLRIAGPLVVVWLTVNTLQQALTAAATSQTVREFPPPIFHLWFLVDLIVYTLLLQLLFQARRPSPALLSRFSSPVVQLAAFVAGAWFVNLAVRATGFAYKDLAGLTSAFRLVTYLPYFLLGAWMFRQRAALDSFNRLGWVAVLAGLAISLIADPLTTKGPLWQRELALLAQLASTIVCIGGLLGVLRRLFRKPSGASTLLSDSAYTIYLLHHVVVVAVGLWLLHAAWPAGLKYTVVVGAAISIPLAVHLLCIKRFNWLSWALNGKPLGAAARPAVRAAPGAPL
ncbi:acyltransferase family protein [Pseudorhodoferax sp.]|uniref:acyltransferase family protein n=1 Tax=Pseudorhodoferax sp. TaxID=1993553 RepID=UPI002DD66857|nr:acyltransferase family protein [Pseudorhodoferax sp.]